MQIGRVVVIGLLACAGCKEDPVSTMDAGADAGGAIDMGVADAGVVPDAGPPDTGVTEVSSCAAPLMLELVSSSSSADVWHFLGDDFLAGDFTEGSCKTATGTPGRDVVFAYTPPFAGVLRISTFGFGTDYPTVMYAQSPCGSRIGELACGRCRTNCEAFARVSTDPVWLVVEGDGADAIGHFELDVELHPYLLEGARCGRNINHDMCGPGLLCRREGTVGRCRVAMCGDGLVEGNEECDDHNNLEGDGCTADCKLGVQGPGGESCAAPETLYFPSVGPLFGRQIGWGQAEGQTSSVADDLDLPCATSPGAPDVVYAFDLSVEAELNVEAAAEDFDAVVALFAGTCGGTPLICVNELNNPLSIGPITLTPGRYYLVIDGAAAGERGHYGVLGLTAVPL